MLSGMGPTPILNKFKIPVYINNLEFGRNIHDHRRHCQASYGIFGQILISLMPRHTIFLFFSPSQSNIYNMCKSDLSSRPLQLHVSSASSTSNFLEHDLFNLRFDDIWYITVRADPLWSWVSAQLCTEPSSMRPLWLSMTAYANFSTTNRHLFNCFREDQGMFAAAPSQVERVTNVRCKCWPNRFYQVWSRWRLLDPIGLQTCSRLSSMLDRVNWGSMPKSNGDRFECSSGCW